MKTPVEAVAETVSYLRICFLGMPFIVAYNVVCSIFRGIGGSKSPMYFVGIACIINIVLDFLLIGGMGMGAVGAAMGTIIGQISSVLFALLVICKRDPGFTFDRRFLSLDRVVLKQILKGGTPIAC